MPNIGDLYVGGIKPVVSGALVSEFQLSATGPGRVYDLTVLNFATSARLVLLLDQTAQPAINQAANVTPIWFYPIPAAATTPGAIGLAYTVPPIQFINGLWVVLSTTLTTPYSMVVSASNDGAFSGLVTIG